MPSSPKVSYIFACTWFSERSKSLHVGVLKSLFEKLYEAKLITWEVLFVIPPSV